MSNACFFLLLFQCVGLYSIAGRYVCAWEYGNLRPRVRSWRVLGVQSNTGLKGCCVGVGTSGRRFFVVVGPVPLQSRINIQSSMYSREGVHLMHEVVRRMELPFFTPIATFSRADFRRIRHDCTTD